MVRTRLAALAVAAGLCGCSTLANHPWFNHTPRPVSECAGCPTCPGCPGYGGEVGAYPVTEGPVLGDAPVVVPAVPGNGNGLVPQPGVPPLTSPPRLVPQPAQPIPYQP